MEGKIRFICLFREGFNYFIYISTFTDEMLDWSIDWRYICTDFIVNSFLIWCLTLFDFRLHNIKFEVSPRDS